MLNEPQLKLYKCEALAFDEKDINKSATKRMTMMISLVTGDTFFILYPFIIYQLNIQREFRGIDQSGQEPMHNIENYTNADSITRVLVFSCHKYPSG